MKPFFSVVIPTLNEEKFLPKLLDDLSRQKYRNFEVIIVDGSSVDETIKIAESEHGFPVQVIAAQKQNVSIQRNTGAALAKGEYIVFIDADSRILPEFLRTARQEIQKSRHLLYIPKTVPDMQNTPYELYIALSNLAVELSQNTPRPFSNSGTFFVERHFFDHVGGFDSKLKLSEDHDLIQRARNIGVIAQFSRKIEFVFSLRRYEKDGLLKILMKYTIAIFYSLTNKRVEKELFSYEMGGLRYDAADQHKTFDEFKKLYKKVMKTLEKTF